MAEWKSNFSPVMANKWGSMTTSLQLAPSLRQQIRSKVPVLSFDQSPHRRTLMTRGSRVCAGAVLRGGWIKKSRGADLNISEVPHEIF